MCLGLLRRQTTTFNITSLSSFSFVNQQKRFSSSSSCLKLFQQTKPLLFSNNHQQTRIMFSPSTGTNTNEPVVGDGLDKTQTNVDLKKQQSSSSAAANSGSRSATPPPHQNATSTTSAGSADNNNSCKNTPRKKKMHMQTSAPCASKVHHTVKFGNIPVKGTKEHPLVLGDPKKNTLIDPPIEMDDHYHWIRDDTRKNTEVLNLLRAENEFFEYKTDDQLDLQDKIYDEHIGHIKETDDAVPTRHGPFKYWTKTFEGKSYSVHVRAPHNEENPTAESTETLLDINELAAGRVQCDVRSVKPDPRHHVVFAYSLDLVGDELYTIHFRKCKNFEAEQEATQNHPFRSDITEKKIEGTTGSILWMPHSDALIYCTRDEAKRADKVWLHLISSPDTKKDVLLFHEEDQSFSVDAGLSRDGKYLIVHCGGYDGDEVWFCPLYRLNNDPTKVTKDTFKCIKKRKHNHHYSVETWNAGHFLIVSDADGAKTNKLVYVNEERLDDWSNVLIPSIPERTIDSVLALKHGLIVDGRSDGLTQIWTIPVAEAQRNYDHQEISTKVVSPDFFAKCFGATSDLSSSLQMMKQEEPLYEVALIYSASKHFDVDVFRVTYSSMVTPQRWMEVSIFDTSAAPKILKQRETPNYDPSLYVCERRWATAPDGVKVPMSILRKKTTNIPSEDEVKAKGEEWEPATYPPTHFYYYGCYGVCIDPAFKISPLPLLDRGFVYVVCHVRGGGEMGRSWYEEQGKLFTKRNTFSDAIACLESMHYEHKISTPKKSSIEGRSAGGTAVGVLVNTRPDLFNAALSGVGFVDVLVTLQDSTIPLTTEEWGLLGNPNCTQYFDYIKSYCPMTNIKKQKQPNCLFTAGLHDPRVGYFEVAKFVQKLREYNVGKSEIIAKFELESGHFSANDRYKYFRELARDQAWLVKMLTGKLE